MKVEWHPRALADAEELVAYIAAENIDAAYRVHEVIAAQVEMLARFAEMGRPGRVAGTRELVISDTPYIVAYRVTDESIRVLRVLHGARRWPKRL